MTRLVLLHGSVTNGRLAWPRRRAPAGRVPAFNELLAGFVDAA